MSNKPAGVPRFSADQLEEGVRLLLDYNRRYNQREIGTSAAALENRYLDLGSLASHLSNVSRRAFLFPQEVAIREIVLHHPYNRTQEEFLRYFAYASMSAVKCHYLGIPAREILWEAGDHYGFSRIELINMALVVWENELQRGETKRSNQEVYDDMLARLLVQ